MAWIHTQRRVPSLSSQLGATALDRHAPRLERQGGVLHTRKLFAVRGRELMQPAGLGCAPKNVLKSIARQVVLGDQRQRCAVGACGIEQRAALEMERRAGSAGGLPGITIGQRTMRSSGRER